MICFASTKEGTKLGQFHCAGSVNKVKDANVFELLALCRLWPSSNSQQRQRKRWALELQLTNCLSVLGQQFNCRYLIRSDNIELLSARDLPSTARHASTTQFAISKQRSATGMSAFCRKYNLSAHVKIKELARKHSTRAATASIAVFCYTRPRSA